MKKLISFILTVSMIMSLSAFSPSASAAVTEEDGIISLMRALEIMQGDENGDMGLDRLVSRAEFSKIAVAASPAKNTVAIGLKMSPYKDVPYTEWFAPYVRAAVSAGYIKGYLDATYRPNNPVTYEEAVTVMLRVLNYGDGDFGAAYPYGQLSKAQGLDMLDNVNGEIGQNLTRRQVTRLIYNTLQASAAAQSSALSMQAGIGQQGAQTVAQSTGVSFSGQLLSVHECAMTEDTDIIAGFAQDKTLGTDKIFTSAGTYTKGEYFNDSSVGMTGTVFIKNSRDIIAFVPDEDRAEEYETYFVYSTLANSVVGYSGGDFETINIPDGTTVYRDHTPTSYAAIKSGLEMGDTLYVKRAPGGSIDYITYESSTMEGPVKVTSGNWLSSIGGGASSTIMRDGVRSSESAVMPNDIIYYSAPLDIVFAYSNKVTGIYENALPTKDSPTNVVISGVTYAVEGVDAFNNLSSSGSFNYGDTVTICIGKDGGAAGVVTAESGITDTQITGYVTDAGSRLFTDSNNREYSSYYITLVTPDGAEGTYETAANRSSLVGSVCSLTLKDGKAQIGRISSNTDIGGKVSYSSLRLGEYTLSPNANILDVSNDNVFDMVLYKRVYTQRIDGLTLSPSQILYCEKNAMNEITALILNNVTGDVYTYGAVNSSRNGSYGIDINGTSGTYQSSFNRDYHGPARIMLDKGQLKGIITINSYSGSVSALTQSTATINSVTYKLSDNIICYYNTLGSSYRKISIDEAINGNYTVTAYYDKPEANGGRIRVLVCAPK